MALPFLSSLCCGREAFSILFTVYTGKENVLKNPTPCLKTRTLRNPSLNLLLFAFLFHVRLEI